MPHQRFRALVGDDADRGVAIEGMGQVDQLPVDDAGDRRFGQVRRDLFRHAAYERPGWHTAHRAVGKSN
jgi:hypothetical protein